MAKDDNLKAKYAKLQETTQKLEEMIADLQADNDLLLADIDRLQHEKLLIQASSAETNPFPLEILNSIPDPIFYKDLNGVYRVCNSAFSRKYGLEPSELCGKTDFDLLPIDEAIKVSASDTDVMAKGQSSRFETPGYSKPSHSIFFETLKIPFYDSESEIQGIIGVAREITERKALEEKLAENIDHFAHHAECMSLLYDLANTLSKVTDTETIFRSTAITTRLITQCDAISVALLNETGDELSIYFLNDDDGLISINKNYSVEDTIL